MIRRDRFPRCEITGKIRYPEHNDATQAVAAARRARTHAELTGGHCTNRVDRSYWCEHCHGWHLTSQSRRRTALPALTCHVAARIAAASAH